MCGLCLYLYFIDMETGLERLNNRSSDIILLYDCFHCNYYLYFCEGYYYGIGEWRAKKKGMPVEDFKVQSEMVAFSNEVSVKLEVFAYELLIY